MKTVEFLTELSGKPVLMIPQDVVAKLPKSGPARVIVLTGKDADESEWRKAAYEQFMREDAPEDSVYDTEGCSGISEPGLLRSTSSPNI